MCKAWLLFVLLVLVLAVPAWAQVIRVGEERQPQPTARVQVTQTLTIAVCGDTCDCGSATLVSKESGFLPTFGDMPFWNSLASGGVLPYISSYPLRNYPDAGGTRTRRCPRDCIHGRRSQLSSQHRLPPS